MELENSFEKIYRTYFMEVYSYVMTLVKNPEQAQEITQETFFRAIKGKNSYRGDSGECTWLCAIAKNLCVDSFRKRRENVELDEETPASVDIEKMMMDKAASLQIHQILHSLEEPYKEVFSLRVFGELSFQTIGQIFGKTENWARVTHHRARLKIQEKNNILTIHERKERRKTFTVGIITAAILLVPVMICLICNLVIGHALDWFFIVLASMLVVASLTTLPLVVEKRKWVWAIIGFTVSLLFLLLVCCIYTRGSWFLVAAASSILGLSVFLVPYVICNIPLPQFLKDKRGLTVMMWDTLWLYILIAVCGIFVHAGSYYWHTALLLTTYCLWLPWFIFMVCRYFNVNGFTRAGLIVIASGIFTGFTNDVISAVTGLQNEGSIFDADMTAGYTGSNLRVLNGNIMLTILIISILAGGLLIAAGMTMKGKGDRGEQKRDEKN